MIRAVIFDMDGVLIDARDWHFEALNRALRLFGYQIDGGDHATIFDGLPTRRKLHILSASSGLPEGLHDFINEMKQRYTTEIVHASCKPRFVHRYALGRLRAEGYRLAVASNAVRDMVGLMLRKAELDMYLDFFLSNQDVSHPKPDPEIYQRSIARLALSPGECLVVEDNAYGVRAARAAGAHVLEVRDGADVTYDAIMQQIAACQDQHAA